MKRKIYSIYDKKAQLYCPPFYEISDPMAIRVVHTAIQTETMLAVNANDYSLYWLGSFDDVSGIYETQPPEHVIEIKQLVDNPGE